MFRGALCCLVLDEQAEHYQELRREIGYHDGYAAAAPCEDAALFEGLEGEHAVGSYEGQRAYERQYEIEPRKGAPAQQGGKAHRHQEKHVYGDRQLHRFIDVGEKLPADEDTVDYVGDDRQIKQRRYVHALKRTEESGNVEKMPEQESQQATGKKRPRA